jgi:hypothetical protein
MKGMELTLNTPSLLFPAISLLMLAYTNRFFIGELSFARIIFQLSLVLLAMSLSLTVWEIQISTNALSVELSDLEDLRDRK